MSASFSLANDWIINVTSVHWNKVDRRCVFRVLLFAKMCCQQRKGQRHELKFHIETGIYGNEPITRGEVAQGPRGDILEVLVNSRFGIFRVILPSSYKASAPLLVFKIDGLKENFGNHQFITQKSIMKYR